MKLSTRNQLVGTVTAVTTGEAMAVVKVQLEAGPETTSSITRDAAEDLGLEVGSKVTGSSGRRCGTLPARELDLGHHTVAEYRPCRPCGCGPGRRDTIAV